jgi:hypothetical protein
MKTPYGKDCYYFYGNYYRGRNDEECRLLGEATPRLAWKRELCSACPVPEILIANACQYMDLVPRLERPFPFTKQIVSVKPYCRKEGRSGFDPHVGCGNCHPIPDIFTKFEKS